MGEEWATRDLILGQLIYVRDFNRQKFDANANAKPAIFAGYGLDTVPNTKVYTWC